MTTFGDYSVHQPSPRIDTSSFDFDQVRIIEAESVEGARPVRGDIWWTASSFEGPAGYEEVDRLPFVILDDFEDADREWIDAAPLWHDVDLANEVDIVFEPHCTTLEMPLRFQLRRQITLAFEQFEDKLGEVREEGLEMIDAAKRGDLPLEHLGIAYEDPNDWRLIADQWIAELIATLQGPYFAALQQADDAVSEAGFAGADLTPLFIHFDARLKHLAPRADHEFALAAAKGASQRKMVELCATEHQLFALLWANAVKGVLELEIQRVADEFLSSLQVVVGLKSGESVASDPFVPRPHTVVTFAEDLGVTPGAIDLNKIEARVLSG
jgi:hypothetical protein